MIVLLTSYASQKFAKLQCVAEKHALAYRAKLRFALDVLPSLFSPPIRSMGGRGPYICIYIWEGGGRDRPTRIPNLVRRSVLLTFFYFKKKQRSASPPFFFLGKAAEI